LVTDFQIKCFLAVAAKLNFTKAARTLYISQSSISRQIYLLEQELEFSLFQRSTKMVRLTPAGELMHQHLTVMSKQFDNLIAQARAIANVEKENLCVGCVVQEKSNAFLADLLIAFQKEHPHVTVRKERNNHKNLLNGLADGYYDAILIPQHDILHRENIDSITLLENPLRVVIHRNHPLFKHDNVKLSDLSDSPFLQYKPTDLPEKDDYLFNLCRHFGFSPKIVAEFEDFDEFLYAVESGKGISIICEEIEILGNPNLRLVTIEDCPYKYLPIQLTVFRSNPNPALKKLFDFAKKYLQ
jgi:DNA-binding transcriptional LysR family regulator